MFVVFQHHRPTGWFWFLASLLSGKGVFYFLMLCLLTDPNWPSHAPTEVLVAQHLQLMLQPHF